MYVSETEDPRRRGRPLVRWKDRVNEYMHERGTDRERRLQQVRSECLDWWRLFCRGHPLGGCSQR